MADIQKVFRRLADELDAEERNDLLLSLQDKKLTPKELADAIREMPDAERAEIRDALIDVGSNSKGELKREVKKLEDEAQEEEEAKSVENVVEEKRKTRPGRKHGRAYDYTIEKGRVKLLDVAHVYQGEDEPDEVDIIEEEDEEEEEE